VPLHQSPRARVSRVRTGGSFRATVAGGKVDAARGRSAHAQLLLVVEEAVGVGGHVKDQVERVCAQKGRQRAGECARVLQGRLVCDANQRRVSGWVVPDEVAGSAGAVGRGALYNVEAIAAKKLVDNLLHVTVAVKQHAPVLRQLQVLEGELGALGDAPKGGLVRIGVTHRPVQKL